MGLPEVDRSVRFRLTSAKFSARAKLASAENKHEYLAEGVTSLGSLGPGARSRLDQANERVLWRAPG